MIHPFDLEDMEDRLQRLLAAEAIRTGAHHKDRVQTDTVVGPALGANVHLQVDGAGAQGSGGGAQ